MKTRSIRFSILAAASAAIAGAVWLPFIYAHLFLAPPNGRSALQAAAEQFTFDLSPESPSRVLMAIWYSMPVAWFTVAALFFALHRFSHRSSWFAVAVALGLAVASSAMFGWGTAVIFGAPACFGFAHMRRPGGTAKPPSSALGTHDAA